MTVALTVLVAALLVIALSEPLGDKTGVVAPIILLVVGIGAGLLPQFPNVVIDPHILIEGILPPLLFSAAVNMPTQDFRRNLGSISILSIGLVIVSSVGLGFLFHAIMTDMNLATAIALGAIMSPTDAVATTIVKKQGVSRRVVTILEGEGLINDAAALVILRSAIAATAGSVSFLQVSVAFVWSVVGALIVGMIVGHLGLWLRRKMHEARTSAIISFTVPFMASIPAEHLGASGLVAAVVAGLVMAHHVAGTLPPGHRLMTRQTWATLGLVLESLVFLLMGIQLSALLVDFHAEEHTWTYALLIALIASVALLAIRAIVVFVMTRLMHDSAQRKIARSGRVADFGKALDEIASGERPMPEGREISQRRLEHAQHRITVRLADVDYYENAHMGPRDAVVIFWSGMRGAVTLAAAQTLPLDTPDRGFLLLLAFLVAAGSLIVQGGTLAWVVRWVKPATASPVTSQVVRSVRAVLHEATQDHPVPAELCAVIGNSRPEDVWTQLARWQHGHVPHSSDPDDPVEIAEQQRVKVMVITYGIELLEAQRQALISERDRGHVDADLYRHCLGLLDADQMRLEMHLEAARAGVEDAVEDSLSD